MKLIQSIWFDNYDLLKGNWPAEKFALFSMALSHHLLKKQGLPTCLYTNAVGFDIVVNRIGLKYDEVNMCLERDRLATSTVHFFDKYWSLYKLYTYSLQEQPFIHFDNDVYFFKRLDDSWKTAALVAQNQETGLPYYNICLEEIQRHFTQIPTYLNIEPQSVMAINAGIAGGTKFDFFKQLYLQVIGLLIDNEVHLNKLTEGYANIFIEQCMMKNYANSLGLQFQYALPNTIGPSKEYRANKFHLLPDRADYIHVMNYKSNPTVCESIARMLYYTNRHLYNHCIQVSQSIRGSRQPVHRIKHKESINNASASLKYFFRRTAQIYALIRGHSLRFSSVETLSEDIYLAEKSITHESFEVLLDVFVFELDRYQFFTDINSDYLPNMYQSFSESQIVILENNWENCYIISTEITKFIESRWNWVEANEFSELSANHYLKNVNISPGYFTTLLYYYPEQHISREHLLGPCDSLIVRLAKDIVLVKELVSSVSRHMLGQEKRLCSRAYIEERIRFFIFQGVLLLSIS
jgi:hypothetical protein